MNPTAPARTNNAAPTRLRNRTGRVGFALLLAGLSLRPSPAHASLFHGETLDKLADVMSWVVLIVAPTVAIAVFWIVHILPEKIAEKRKHPQAKAIQTLCLLSLFFGGLLWPIAWLWAYTKPVLHKLAYGTDVEEHHGAHDKPAGPTDENDVAQFRRRIAELETKLTESTGPAGEPS